MSSIFNEDIEYETTTSRRNVFFWAMYDLANTIYSMVIVSLIINRSIRKFNDLWYCQFSLWCS